MVHPAFYYGSHVVLGDSLMTSAPLSLFESPLTIRPSLTLMQPFVLQ
jgi:hypothetical protein